MHVLVVYYSRTDNTAQVAKAIADHLSAELEDIHETRNRMGLFAYLRAGYEPMKKRAPAIEPISRNPEDYDLVILGCPVWAGNVATPMRAYASQHGGKIKRLAVFCTEGGAGVLRALSLLCSNKAIVEMIVTEGQLKSGKWTKLVDRFVTDIQKTA